jgi:hypothetical protein
MRSSSPSHLTMSLSGRLLTQIARCARTIIPARTARLLSSHGRSKRWLEGGSEGGKLNCLRACDPLKRFSGNCTEYASCIADGET